MRRSILALALLACGLLAAPAHAAPRIKHVWVIVLENQDADTTFGANSPAPYLAKTLRRRGQFLPNFYGVTHLSLGNYIAMVSGQGSNFQTQTDCQQFTNLAPGTIGPDGQAVGQGCVYPKNVKTVADQLQAKGLGWRGYMQDMGSDPSREGSRCAHPAIGAQDKTQKATAKDQYATRHNPFVYFHSLLDSGACAKYDIPLTGLKSALTGYRLPALTFITPDLCSDAHDAKCADPKQKGGLPGADAFLRTWIPRIQASRAYRDSGMIAVTFDEAENDSSACCGEPQFLPTNTAPFPTNGGLESGPGGGRTGTVLLSKYVKAGSVNKTPYNHFSLLRSVEDIFRLGHLGYAARSGLKAFGRDVYNGCPGAFGRPRARHGVLRRGALVSSARVSGRTLTVRMRRGARLGALVHRHEVIGPRHVRECRTYRFRLHGHGRLELRARRYNALERRYLRF